MAPRRLRGPAAAGVVCCLLGLAVIAASCSSSPSTKSASRTTTSVTSAPTTSAPSIPATSVPDATTVGPLAPLQGGAAAVAAPTGATVSPPASIASDCSKDVSEPLKKFLKSLPSGSTVVSSPQACYQVDRGLKLTNKQNLTIYGGTFTNDSTTPGKQKGSRGEAVFTLIGGSNISFENLKITGKNPGGYHSAMAFSSGINVEGTKGITIEGVSISNTFGDGITLDPLRGGAGHTSGTILNAPSNLVVKGVTITEAGRQGMGFGSISGAQISNLVVVDPAQTTFDFEADQHNEGAVNVTIDGCSSTGDGLFFANGGAGSGKNTHNITVSHCAMTKPAAGHSIAGYAIYSSGRKNDKAQRGPIDFVADQFYCGASSSVACVELSNANVTVENSVMHFPNGTVHERVYHLKKHASAVFTNDTVTGYGHPGVASSNSSVKVQAGHWVSSSGAALPT